MIRSEELIKIGHFNKPHGVKGELSLTFTDDVFDRCDSPYIVCAIDGIFVPFFIEEYRYKNDTTLLIKLVDVDTESQAAPFSLLDVYYPRCYYIEGEEQLALSDLFVGYAIVDAEHGNLGMVTAVDDSTANVLFVVASPDGDELLIPAQDSLVQRIDDESHIIYMSLPPGLVDL